MGHKLPMTLVGTLQSTKNHRGVTKPPLRCDRETGWGCQVIKGGHDYVHTQGQEKQVYVK